MGSRTKIQKRKGGEEKTGDPRKRGDSAIWAISAAEYISTFIRLCFNAVKVDFYTF